jgi:transcriptional regulator with XRE-family HTH domain
MTVEKDKDKKRIREENPDRLARLLKAIRVEVLHLTQAEMAEKLKKLARPDTRAEPDKSVPSVDFSQTVVTAIEQRKIGYRYAHLEAYARVIGVPVGTLLTVSRYSTVDDPATSYDPLIDHLGRFVDILKRAKLEHRSLTVYDLHALAGVPDPELAPLTIRSDVLEGAASAMDRLSRVKRELDEHGVDPIEGLGLFKASGH